MAPTQKKQKRVDQYAARAITPTFRAAFPHVFKAQAPKGTDKLKYSVTMLFPKDADLTCTTLPNGEGAVQKLKLQTLIKNAKLNMYGSEENWPDDIQSPVTDGDDPKHADKQGYKGHWVIKATCSEDQKPSVVARDGTPIIDQADFYPGCYARAYVYARVWEYMGKTGVQFILDHVQKVKDGPSFGGKKPVEQVFGPMAGVEEELDEEMIF